MDDLHGYKIETCGDGHRYLMHGQRTPGLNNGVRIKSIREAKRIAAYWSQHGVRRPYAEAAEQ